MLMFTKLPPLHWCTSALRSYVVVSGQETNKHHFVTVHIWLLVNSWDGFEIGCRHKYKHRSCTAHSVTMIFIQHAFVMLLSSLVGGLSLKPILFEASANTIFFDMGENRSLCVVAR